MGVRERLRSFPELHPTAQFPTAFATERQVSERPSHLNLLDEFRCHTLDIVEPVTLIDRRRLGRRKRVHLYLRLPVAAKAGQTDQPGFSFLDNAPLHLTDCFSLTQNLGLESGRHFGLYRSHERDLQ